MEDAIAAPAPAMPLLEDQAPEPDMPGADPIGEALPERRSQGMGHFRPPRRVLLHLTLLLIVALPGGELGEGVWYGSTCCYV
jgi:hypothetical protein